MSICITIRGLPYTVATSSPETCYIAVVGDGVLGRPRRVSIVGAVGGVGNVAVGGAAGRTTWVGCDSLAVSLGVVVVSQEYTPVGDITIACRTIRFRPFAEAVPSTCPVVATLPSIAQRVVVSGGNLTYRFGYPSLTQSLTSAIPVTGWDSLTLGSVSVLSGTSYISPPSINPPTPDVGTPTVYLAWQRIILSGVPSALVFGVATVSRKTEHIKDVGGVSLLAGGTADVANKDLGVFVNGVPAPTFIGDVHLEHVDKNVSVYGGDNLVIGEITLTDNFLRIYLSSAGSHMQCGGLAINKLRTVVATNPIDTARVGVLSISNKLRYVLPTGVDANVSGSVTVGNLNTFAASGIDKLVVGTLTLYNRVQYVSAVGVPPTVVFGNPATELKDRDVLLTGVDSAQLSVGLSIVGLTTPYISGVDTLVVGAVSVSNLRQYITLVGSDLLGVGAITIKNRRYIVAPQGIDVARPGDLYIRNRLAYITPAGVDHSAVGVAVVMLRTKIVTVASAGSSATIGIPNLDIWDGKVRPTGIAPIAGGVSPIVIPHYLQVITPDSFEQTNLYWGTNSAVLYPIFGASGMAAYSPMTMRISSIESPPSGGTPILFPNTQIISASPAIELDPETDVYYDPKIPVEMVWVDYGGGWHWGIGYEESLIRADAISPVVITQDPPNTTTQYIRADCADPVGCVVMYVAVNNSIDDDGINYLTQRIVTTGEEMGWVTGRSLEFGTIEVDPTTNSVYVKPDPNRTSVSDVEFAYSVAYPIITSTGCILYNDVDNSSFGSPYLYNKTQYVQPEGGIGHIQPHINELRADRFMNGIRQPGDFIEWIDLTGAFLWDYVNPATLATDPNYYPITRFNSQFGRLYVGTKRVGMAGVNTAIMGIPMVGHRIRYLSIDSAAPPPADSPLVGASDFSVVNAVSGEPHIVYVNYGIPPPQLGQPLIYG